MKTHHKAVCKSMGPTIKILLYYKTGSGTSPLDKKVYSTYS